MKQLSLLLTVIFLTFGLIDCSENETSVEQVKIKARVVEEETSNDDNKEETETIIEANTVDYSEDQNDAEFTVKEITDKYPIDMSYNDYVADMNGKITPAEGYTLKNNNMFQVLIAKDGFVGVETDGDKILKVKTFKTFEEASKYANDNK